MNIADYICEYLAAYHVRYIYGYPGAAILPLLDAINNHPKLEWVLMRHEGSAIYAAAAQAKLTQQLTVCIATSGPGATNLVTGLIDADLDSAPVLVITGLISIFKHNLAHFQDINHVDLFRSCCGMSAACSYPLQAPQLLQTTVGYAIKNLRPAHLAIANEVQNYELNEHELDSANVHLKKLQQPVDLMVPAISSIESVAKILNQSTNVIIAVGPRARNAGSQIEKLAEKLQAPIICTFAGKGVIKEDHANYFGILGLFGVPVNDNAMYAIRNAKVILAFGVDDLVYFLTNTDIDRQCELIQCEPNITNLSCQFVQKSILFGRIDVIATELATRVKPVSSDLLDDIRKNQQKIIQKTPKEVAISPHKVHQNYFLEHLNPYIDKKNLVLALDIGDATIWAINCLKLTHRQSVVVSNRMGTMGFCLPAMIAAKLSQPESLVVGICGDGGIQMVLGEINTAVQLNLNMILIIFNNDALQRVIAQQSKEKYGTILKNPNYQELAKSCGAIGITIEEEKEIAEKLKEAFSIQSGFVIIDVKCDPHIFANVLDN